MSRLLKLTSAERAVVLLAVMSLLIAPITLRLLGLARLMRYLGYRRHHATTHVGRVAPCRVVSLVERTASSLPWATTCLERTLVAAWLMRRGDHPCRVVLGVATPVATAFAAHAWIAMSHHTDDSSRRYTPICEWAIAATPFPH